MLGDISDRDKYLRMREGMNSDLKKAMLVFTGIPYGQFAASAARIDPSLMKARKEKQAKESKKDLDLGFDLLYGQQRQQIRCLSAILGRSISPHFWLETFCARQKARHQGIEARDLSSRGRSTWSLSPLQGNGTLPS